MHNYIHVLSDISYIFFANYFTMGLYIYIYIYINVKSSTPTTTIALLLRCTEDMYEGHEGFTDQLDATVAGEAVSTDAHCSAAQYAQCFVCLCLSALHTNVCIHHIIYGRQLSYINIYILCTQLCMNKLIYKCQ